MANIQQILLSAIISITTIASRIAFYLTDFTLPSVIYGFKCIRLQSSEDSEFDTPIKPTYKNAKVIVVWIARSFDYRLTMENKPQQPVDNDFCFSPDTVELYNRCYLLKIYKESIETTKFFSYYVSYKIIVILVILLCSYHTHNSFQEMTFLLVLTNKFEKRNFVKVKPMVHPKLKNINEQKPTRQRGVLLPEGAKQLPYQNPDKADHYQDYFRQLS